jgi:putative aldouronate transport system substrate-binding protein
MDELANVVDAFVKADLDGDGKQNTVGIVLDKTLFSSTRGAFNSFDAFPAVWVKTANGLQWGGTTDSNKKALAWLANQYKLGHIDPEWITQDGNASQRSVLAGKSGIMYGGHWLAHAINPLHEKDPNSAWRIIALPTGTGQPVKSAIKPTHQGWLAVNKKFKNPEVAFKLRGLTTYTLSGSKDAAWWNYEENLTYQLAPVRGNVSPYSNLDTYKNLLEVFKNKDTSQLKGKAVPYWANLNGTAKWEWDLMFGPGDHTPMNTLNQQNNNGLLFVDAFQGPPGDIMQKTWKTITDEQLIQFSKIIIGEVSVEQGFDTWLKTFQSMGGDKVTKEVNDWYKSSQSK